METLVAILQGIAIFLVGLVARVGIVVAVMAALMAPVVLAIGVVRTVRWAARRWHAAHEGRA